MVKAKSDYLFYFDEYLLSSISNNNINEDAESLHYNLFKIKKQIEIQKIILPNKLLFIELLENINEIVQTTIEEKRKLMTIGTISRIRKKDSYKNIIIYFLNNKFILDLCYIIGQYL
jgi:hypothetical protein